MSPRSCSVETSRDVFLAMQAQESTPYWHSSFNPYRQICPSKDSFVVDEEWRLKIAQWKYQVVDHFRFEREVVSISMNYLDRVLVSPFTNFGEKTSRDTKRELQLMAVTSLYLAIKLHGTLSEEDTYTEKGERKSLRAYAFVVLSQNQHSVEDIESMERRILSSLEWRLNPPTPLSFVLRLLHLIPRWSSSSSRVVDCRQAMGSIIERAQYLVEISVCLSDLSLLVKPSELAFGAIVKSLDTLQEEGIVILPRKIRRAFLKNAAVLSLNPHSDQVRQVCALLDDACPVGLEIDDAVTLDDSSMPHANEHNHHAPQEKATTAHSIAVVSPLVQTPLQYSTAKATTDSSTVTPEHPRKRSPVSVNDFDGSEDSAARKRPRSPC